MKINYFGFLIIALLAVGCSSTKEENKYPHLPVKQDELKSPKWAELNRFPARYPENAAIKTIEGCATIEYVVTPENEVEDIKVLSTTEKQFGVEAAKVIKNWKWSDLPKGIITEPVKTQTRFEFCLEQSNQSCVSKTAKSSCPGEDIIYSKGIRII